MDIRQVFLGAPESCHRGVRLRQLTSQQVRDAGDKAVMELQAIKSDSLKLFHELATLERIRMMLDSVTTKPCNGPADLLKPETQWTKLTLQMLTMPGEFCLELDPVTGLGLFNAKDIDALGKIDARLHTFTEKENQELFASMSLVTTDT